MLRSPYVGRGLATSIAIATSLLLGVLLLSSGFRSPLAWLPTGLAAAAMLRWGRDQWPWIALGALAAGAVSGAAIIGAVAGTIALVSGPWLLGSWLERHDFRRDFSRRRDVLHFVLATPVAMSVTAGVSLATAYFAGSLAGLPAQWLPRSIEWWMNGTIAVMLIAPPLIAATREQPRAWCHAGRPVLWLLAATAAFCLPMLLVPTAIRGSWMAPLGMLVIIVSAIRMDLTFTGLLSLAMVTVVALASELALGAPPPTEISPVAGRVWAFGVVAAGLTMTLRALLAEREAVDQQLRAAEARHRQGLLEAAAREQERIGRDVHDSLGQELTAISLLARSLELRAHGLSPSLAEDAREIARAGGRAVQSARAIARGLVPAIEHGEDLVRALRSLGDRIAIAGALQVTLHATPGLAIPPEQARDLFRIAQEALNNVLKHSRARHAELRLTAWTPPGAAAAGGGVRLVITDDGVGLAMRTGRQRRAGANGIGQRTMQYRAEITGGRIRFVSAPGHGTRVICTMPLPAAADGGQSARLAVGAERGVSDTPTPHLV